jgi:hypothetical protein
VVNSTAIQLRKALELTSRQANKGVYDYTNSIVSLSSLQIGSYIGTTISIGAVSAFSYFARTGVLPIGVLLGGCALWVLVISVFTTRAKSALASRTGLPCARKGRSPNKIAVIIPSSGGSAETQVDLERISPWVYQSNDCTICLTDTHMLIPFSSDEGYVVELGPRSNEGGWEKYQLPHGLELVYKAGKTS